MTIKSNCGFLFVCFLFLTSALCLGEELLILSTNDTHGQLQPFKTAEMSVPMGGMAERKSIVDSLKKSASNVLVLDSGDVLAGEYISNLFAGRPDIQAMNIIGYQAMAIGNHDFDFGFKNLQKLAAQASFPLLAANIVKKGSDQLLFPPYLVKDFGTFRVGILALSSPETPNTTAKKNVESVEFLDPIATAKKYLPILKQQEKCDLLLILAHLGFEEEKLLAMAVPGYDYIFGGHSHTKLAEEVMVNQTALFTTFEKGITLGATTLEIADHKVTRRHSRPIAVQDVTADPEIKKIIEGHKQDADKKLGLVVGTALSEFTDSKDGIGRYVRLDDMPLSNFINDVLREQSASYNVKKKPADLYLDIGGTYRASLPKGEITLKSLYNVLPSDKTIQFFDATGAELITLLDQFALPKAIENWQHQNALKGGFLLFSGMTLTLDLKEQKISDVKIGGTPINPTQTYRVAIQGHLKAGSDGYTLLPTLNRNFVDSFAVQKDLVAQWFLSKKATRRTIDPKFYDDDRIKIIR